MCIHSRKDIWTYVSSVSTVQVAYDAYEDVKSLAKTISLSYHNIRTYNTSTTLYQLSQNCNTISTLNLIQIILNSKSILLDPTK